MLRLSSAFLGKPVISNWKVFFRVLIWKILPDMEKTLKIWQYFKDTFCLCGPFTAAYGPCQAPEGAGRQDRTENKTIPIIIIKSIVSAILKLNDRPYFISPWLAFKIYRYYIIGFCETKVFK
jgi:hypothetical protein